MPDLRQPTPVRGQIAEQGTAVDYPDRSRSIDDDIEVAWLLRGLRRWWWVAGCGVLAGGALSFALASRAPLLYEASATLVLPKTTGPDGESPPTAGSVRALVTGPKVLGDVLRAIGPSTSVTQADFVGRVLVDEIPGTTLLRLRVRDGDPTRAAELAKLLSDQAVMLSQRLGRETSASAGDRLKVQLDAAADRLRTAEERLLDFQRRSQIELLREDVKALLQQRGEAPSLLLEIERERALLKTVEEELLKRSGSPSGQSQAARAPLMTKDDPPSRAGQLDLSRGDSVTDALDRQVAVSRARLAMLEQARRTLGEVPGAAGLKLLNELHVREMGLARLEADLELTRRVHADLASRYELSRVEASDGGPRLRVLDPDIAPGQPLPRGLLRKAALGVFAGLLVGLAVIAGVQVFGSKPMALSGA